ncbi:hypothetical protein EEY24_00285 (plasmid) [Shewanella algae]|nr:hypothetical protein EEY24_00285 [Shewanella algae]
MAGAPAHLISPMATPPAASDRQLDTQGGRGARPYRINGRRPGTSNQPHGKAAGQQVEAGDIWDDESCF